MARTKMLFLKQSLKWHQWLGWTGGLALLLFALSGMTHPLMVWTGPKAASFFPPQTTMNATHAQALPEILSRHDIKQAIMVKIVPTAKKPVLQVTEYEDKARRYFDLDSGEELKGYDETQAIWLARYYTGLKETPITSIHFQTTFDDAYPWVNRLLPVYRIQFDTEDNRTAFIYTELGAMAGLTNDWKTTLQGIFKAVHTWNWLEDFEHGRVVLMLVLLVSLFGLAATGTAMVFLMKNRKMESQRKWHRFIAYAVWLPLLAFSASGTYHLLHYAYGENHRGLRLSAPLNLSPTQFGDNHAWFEQHGKLILNGLSLVQGEDGNILYRLSIPQGRPGMPIAKQQRFDGTPIEKEALYIDASNGVEIATYDQEKVLLLASQYLNVEEKNVLSVKPVKRFDMHYDFRNKRLPVWEVNLDTPQGDKVFIDPATAMLVDRISTAERYESYSFSFLHKWNFLSPFIGRQPRDIMIVVFLLLAVISTIFGYRMLLKKTAFK